MRLIDADKLEPDRFSMNDGLAISQSQIANAPTVEAIPKDQYEARLKADMVAMLTEIQLEIEELKPNNPNFKGYYEQKVALNNASDIIQQKINELKAESEDRE